jgi:carboxyl-terminal processing protease
MSQNRRIVLAGLVGCLAGVALAAATLGLSRHAAPRPGELPPKDAHLLSEVMGLIRDDYVDKTDDHQLMSNALRGMVGELDPHSSFMDKDEFDDLKIATEGNYSGVGVEVTIEDHVLTVIAPLDGSPAARAGIRSGDAILSIDGKPIGNAPLDTTIARIRGEPGTVVRLGIGREGLDNPLDLSVERAMVTVHSVRHSMLEPGIGYLRISQFSDTTGADTNAALAALVEAAGGSLRGLVLDLRNNPGGVLDAAVEVSDAFLDHGTIVSAEGRSPESRFRMEAMGGDFVRGAPVAVLVNGGSASAAEIVAGALKDNGRAKLLGQKTFGKGSVQTVLPLEDGQALKLTTSLYFTPSGVSIHEKGIQPDVVLPEPAQVALGHAPEGEADPEILAAVNLLKSVPTTVATAP